MLARIRPEYGLATMKLHGEMPSKGKMTDGPGFYSVGKNPIK